MSVPVYNGNSPRNDGSIDLTNQISGALPGQAPGAGGVADPHAKPTGSTAYNGLLFENKAARLGAMLEALGLGDPEAQRSIIGSSLTNFYTSMFDPWMQTAGARGQGVVDNMSNLINQFVGYMNGPGGMGKIEGDARNAITAVTEPNSTYTKGLGQLELLGLLQGFSQLANISKNPWLQKAYGQLGDDAVFNFTQKGANAVKNGLPWDKTGASVLQYLANDPRYQFLVGKR